MNGFDGHRVGSAEHSSVTLSALQYFLWLTLCPRHVIITILQCCPLPKAAVLLPRLSPLVAPPLHSLSPVQRNDITWTSIYVCHYHSSLNIGCNIVCVKKKHNILFNPWEWQHVLFKKLLSKELRLTFLLTFFSCLYNPASTILYNSILYTRNLSQKQVDCRDIKSTRAILIVLLLLLLLLFLLFLLLYLFLNKPLYIHRDLTWSTSPFEIAELTSALYHLNDRFLISLLLGLLYVSDF